MLLRTGGPKSFLLPFSYCIICTVHSIGGVQVISLLIIIMLLLLHLLPPLFPPCCGCIRDRLRGTARSASDTNSSATDDIVCIAVTPVAHIAALTSSLVLQSVVDPVLAAPRLLLVYGMEPCCALDVRSSHLLPLQATLVT